MIQFDEEEMEIILKIVDFTTKHTDDTLDYFIEAANLEYDKEQEFRKKINFYYDDE